jgi:LuxR family maltose regulon positive regulatory protein
MARAFVAPMEVAMTELTSRPDRITQPTLISTKYRPPSGGRTLPRQRLFDLLEGDAPIVVVSAPAGSGKSSLLRSHVETAGAPVAWLNLDDTENDVWRFLGYLLAAINRALPGAVDTAQRLVASDYRPPMDALLTELVNELDGADELAIVLDDYHSISDPAVHEVMGFLVEYLPASVRLIFSGRSEPGVQLSRQRARGRVLDLGLEDLRFTAEEVAKLVEHVLGHAFQEEHLHQLSTRTEGWAAGLVAALSVVSRRMGDGFSLALASSESQIESFLASETLDCIPPRLCDFLLSTSILDRLTGPITTAVSGFEDAPQLLEEAERTILFIVPCGEPLGYRRYHPLFAQALQSRLNREHPGKILELHRRAAAAYIEFGDDERALKHAVEGGDFDLAASVIVRNADRLLARGEMSTVRRWIESLPANQIECRPSVALFYAWALAQSGSLGEAEQQIDRVDSWIERARSGDELAKIAISHPMETEGQVAALRSRIAALRDDPHETIRWTRRAMEILSESQLPHRGGISLNLGHALGRLGDLDGAAEAFAAAAALGPEAGPLVSALGLRYQAGIEVGRGRLGAAGRLYDRAHEIAKARGNEDLPAVGIIFEGMAELAYLRNDLDRAMHLALVSRDRGTRGGEVKISVPANVIIGRVYTARGEYPEALAATERAMALSHWPGTAAWRARILLRMGDVQGAQSWSIEAQCDLQDSINSQDEFVMITYARVLDALGRGSERDWLLEQLRDRANAMGRVSARIELDILMALAAHSRGDTDAAIARLVPALRAGEDAGHIRLFLDEGARIGPLLARAERALTGSSGEPSAGFVGNLRQLLADEQSSELPASVEQTSLIEPLTPREREVLQLISAGRSNQAIASELFLSIGSVKTHSSHLYGKLGVRGRTEAVARARALGLIA